jgi:hypothetical protein
MAIDDVRPVEAQKEDENQIQASTPIQGPEVTGSADVQTSEVPRNNSGGSGVWKLSTTRHCEPAS